ncbi:acyl carrier protein [Streptococcus troglodytae]|nr:acyl carrier protein [Streptococcus troglodytae]
MSNESAITVLEHTLRDKIEENQAIVMYGSEKLRSKLNQMNRSDKKNNNNCTNQSAVTDNNRLIEKTETFFVELFSDLLSISVDELDMDIRFQEYGVDSFIVKEFNEIIEKKLVRLSKTILFEYQTIRELANYVAQEYKEQLCHIFLLKIQQYKRKK